MNATLTGEVKAGALLCKALVLVLAGMLAGCWTFNESIFPEVAVVQASNMATNLTLSVSGFEAMLTEYEAVNGLQTVYVPGHCGPHHYHPSHFEAVPVTTYVAQRRSSDMFLRRAQDDLEKAGYTLAVVNPDVLVDVNFSGPYCDSDDTLAKLGWNLCTIFFCDYEAVSWTAKLRVRDAKTGKLIFHNDYTQRYETKVFGLIPLISAPAHESTTAAHMQSWCLAALTDRAVADTAAFLSASGK